jgi:chromosome segregation ATPase
MALTNRVRQNGWGRQASFPVASQAASATAAMTVVEGENFLLRRGKPEYPETDLDATFEAIEIELARELDEARADIARLDQQLSQQTAAARTLDERVQTSAAAIEAADKRAAELQAQLDAARIQLEELDLITAESARLSQCLAEREAALDNGRARLEFLETALAAAEAKAADNRVEQLDNELRAERDRLQAKIDRLTTENARLSQNAAERDATLGDARARMKFLETALSAAESECAKLAAEVGGARKKHEAEAESLNSRLEAMSSRATGAEKQVVETRQHLLARIVENDGLRHRLAQAETTNDAADSKNRQIDDALRQQRCQIEELERSHATLIEATKTLLETFQDRDRALVSAEERIKFLTERNAQLEAGATHVNGRDEIGRTDMPRHAAEDTDEKRHKDWAQLARQLTDFVERKRRFSEELQLRSMTLLADIASF